MKGALYILFCLTCMIIGTSLALDDARADSGKPLQQKFAMIEVGRDDGYVQGWTFDHVYFDSLDLCNSARQRVMDQFPSETGSYDRKRIEIVCVPVEEKHK